ncbi:hypothetical protein LXL04_032259 [Taraxacum kok-saghyz]
MGDTLFPSLAYISLESTLENPNKTRNTKSFRSRSCKSAMAASSGAKTLPTSSSYSAAAHGSFDLSTGFPPKPSLKPDQLRDCVFRSGFSPSHNYIFRSEIQGATTYSSLPEMEGATGLWSMTLSNGAVRVSQIRFFGVHQYIVVDPGLSRPLPKITPSLPLELGFRAPTLCYLRTKTCYLRQRLRSTFTHARTRVSNEDPLLPANSTIPAVAVSDC